MVCDTRFISLHLGFPLELPTTMIVAAVYAKNTCRQRSQLAIHISRREPHGVVEDLQASNYSLHVHSRQENSSDVFQIGCPVNLERL
jgi:hypothetical protein